MRRISISAAGVLAMAASAYDNAAQAEDGLEQFQAVPFTHVHMHDPIWSKRIDTNRRVTIPYAFKKCEETGRISNFAKAGGLMEGEFEGIYYNDSDVYKVIEGAAYVLADRPDPGLDAYLDDLIAKIAAAQEDDGYLNTFHTLVEPENKWTSVQHKHELYCAGHLFEAAAAHHQATGKRSLLDVAVKLADHIDGIFGPDGRHDAPGHQEIEIGLVRLADITGNDQYVTLAQFFLDQRGRGPRELYGPYCQDHKPVVEQNGPVGHAVRAMYQYCGMADVAARTGDADYIAALHRIWNDMASSKLYLTGGVGARHSGEAFGDNFELPNDTAYCETCAAIGNAMWNHRMNLLTGEAKYMDVVERVIYNGFLSGVSMRGDRFFYPNPLASDGSYHRKAWFSCSCCPVNVTRFAPSIPGYYYARTDEAAIVNLYGASEAVVTIHDQRIRLEQITRYPWEGDVQIIVEPEEDRTFEIRLRIPGWVNHSPVPSELYRYATSPPPPGELPFKLAINGAAPADMRMEHGYAVLRRTWRAGDTIQINFPMPIHRVRADDRVEADRGRLAIERGPIVYCVEAADVGGHVRNLWLPEDAALNARHDRTLLGGITVIRGEAMGVYRSDDGDAEDIRTIPFQAIPYYAWDHRESGEMRVWLPTTRELAEALPAPTIASMSRAAASHCWEGDTVTALNDQIEPDSSGDHSIPRLTWWDHRGGWEWAQYRFEEPMEVRAVDVYWFDDTGRGACRLPEEWDGARAGERRLAPPARRLGVSDPSGRLLHSGVRSDRLRWVALEGPAAGRLLRRRSRMAGSMSVCSPIIRAITTRWTGTPDVTSTNYQTARHTWRQRHTMNAG